jgi:hypothetical protein
MAFADWLDGTVETVPPFLRSSQISVRGMSNVRCEISLREENAFMLYREGECASMLP